MTSRLVFLGAITFSLGATALVGTAHAQVVQGEATVTLGQPPSGQVVVQQPQPYGYPQQQPPPGYGQVYAQPQPYVQPQPYYAQPMQPAQPRVVQREQSITGLWVSGVIILPVSYVLTGLAATTTAGDCGFSGVCRDIDYTLFAWIPLVGPWFMLAQDDSRSLNGEGIGGALLGGITQLAGLTMIILGAALKTTVNVTTYALDASERPTELSFGVGAGQLTATLTHF